MFPDKGISLEYEAWCIIIAIQISAQIFIQSVYRVAGLQ